VDFERTKDEPLSGDRLVLREGKVEGQLVEGFVGLQAQPAEEPAPKLPWSLAPVATSAVAFAAYPKVGTAAEASEWDLVRLFVLGHLREMLVVLAFLAAVRSHCSIMPLRARRDERFENYVASPMPMWS
jgi:hypothetical protein